MATGDPIMINRKLANIVNGLKLVALKARDGATSLPVHV